MFKPGLAQKTMLFALALALYSSEVCAAPSAVAFRLTSSKVCTATLLRPAGEAPSACRLVTNSHCVPEPGNNVQLAVATKTESGKAGPEVTFTSQVLNVNRQSDLAEIAVPDAVKAQTCAKSLKDSKSLPTSSLIGKEISLAALGFPEGKTTVRYSGNLPWPGQAFSRLEKFDVAIPGIGPLLLAKNLSIKKGMSGGPVLDSEMNLIGIVVELEENTDRAILIPIEKVLYFLATNWANDLKPGSSAKPSKPGSKGWNIPSGSKNGSQKLGDNTHADGGDENKQSNPAQNLKKFREADEGIDDPVSPRSGRVLLAVDGQSVSGDRSFRQIVGPSFDPKRHALIYRDADGFPAENIRLSLLDRISGTYVSMVPQKSDYYTFDSVKGWIQTSLSGQTFYAVEISAQKNSSYVIRLTTGEHDVIHATDFLYSRSMPQTARTLEARMEDKGRKIVLTDLASGTRLSCPNKNFLKLICSNEQEELSFAISGADRRSLDLRSASWVQYPAGDGSEIRLLNFKYGEAKSR